MDIWTSARGSESSACVRAPGGRLASPQGCLAAEAENLAAQKDIMDISMCVSVLQACCSPNTAERQAGEDQLKKVCAFLVLIVAGCARKVFILN